MKTILVLNLGMKSIRSIIFDSEGSKLASASMPIETYLTGDMVTQVPEEWWKKACCVIQKTVADTCNIPIDYLTVTASSSCLVCVDRHGKALLPCMMVSDRRAGQESEDLNSAVSFSAVKSSTGLSSSPSLMLPKALWVKKNQEEVFKQIFKLLSPNDYLIAKLTGCYATDYMNAQKWHYDTQQGKYPGTLLAEIGIPESMLPEVVCPGTYIGRVEKSAAEETGLTEKTKVVISTYDAICSFIGSGALEEGEASDVTGTVTVFRTASKRKINLTTDEIQMLPYHEGGIYIIGGSNNLGGGLIEWVKQCYYQNEPLPYELMEKDAGEASLGAGGLIFLPYLLGERTPVWDCNARGVFFGLERMHTRREMTRAVFESTGFIDLDMMGAIEKNGIPIRTIRLSGGLARLNLISQIKADITGRDIQVLSEFETTASGAAMISLFGQGVFTSLREAVNQFVKVRMVIHPEQNSHRNYQELYGLYKETYNTLKPLFPKRMELTEKLYGKKKIQIENL